MLYFLYCLVSVLEQYLAQDFQESNILHCSCTQYTWMDGTFFIPFWGNASIKLISNWAMSPSLSFLRYEHSGFGGGGGNSRWVEESRDDGDWSKPTTRNERLEQWVGAFTPLTVKGFIVKLDRILGVMFLHRIANVSMFVYEQVRPQTVELVNSVLPPSG